MSTALRGAEVGSFCLYCVSLRGTAFSEAAEVISYNMARYPHQPSCTDLIQSAGQGCTLCQLILDSLSRDCRKSGQLDADGNPAYPEGEISIGGVVGPAGQRWIWVGKSHNASGTLRAIEIPRDWKDPWNHEKPDVNEAALLMVNKWIQTCHEAHPDCSRPDDEFMPTRLIQVGPEGADTVRLINSRGAELQDRRYVALSHCWGLSMPHCAQTFRETLTEHLERIRLSNLTKTFVDTIMIARRLRIPFVWIDSLCILQDSRDDWEIEAAQMADVYSNAYVTLAASSSPDGTQGCRIPNDGDESFWPYLDIPVIGNREQKCYRVFGWSNRWNPSLEDDPLQARGWTLQERELSTRIAHFSRDTLIWECRALRASLNFPWQDPAVVIGHRRVFDTDGVGRRLPGTSHSVPDSTEEQKLLAAAEWFRLVKLYSRRCLTKQTDVLPAMSGVARIFSRFTPGAYCAGLFESHGIISLLWAVDRPQKDKTVSKTSRRPSQYMAPSWSWASLVGAVSWSWYPPQDRIEAVATIQSIMLTPAGMDDFSQLKDGSLRMSGKLRKLRARRIEHAYGSSGDPAGLALFATTRGVETKVGWITFDVLDEVCESVYCLACARIGFPWPQVYGLALLPVDNDSLEPSYRRVGRVRTGEKTWLEESLLTEIVII
ncbi:HET-domain-containing protein [Hypoxylon sp. FL0543]|nr:HET-domain-containing protein [Hypoxylon sp. FL0543]